LSPSSESLNNNIPITDQLGGTGTASIEHLPSYFSDSLISARLIQSLKG